MFPPVPRDRASLPIVVVDSVPHGLNLGLKELWRRREVVYFLAWRNLKVRYQQTYAGVSWAVIQPVLSMLVFTSVFGRWVGVPSDGIPYPPFSYAGLVPWSFVTASIQFMVFSLVANASLILKIYLPRLALPVAALATYVVDLAIALALLVPLMVYYRIAPDARLLLLPGLVGIASALALGLGTWAAALEVRYRDVSNVIRFVIQLWLYATPVIYPTSIVPARWARILALNPMVAVIEGFRAALFARPVPWGHLAYAVLASGAVLYCGLRSFRRAESTFADVI